MSILNNIDIDVLETTLGLMPGSQSEEQLDRTYNKIMKLVHKKDKMINDQRVELEKIKSVLDHQDKVIKRQLEEICLLHHALESYNYYPKHPNDSYLIDFGYPKWKKMTYRMCISLKEGEKIVKWVNKKNRDNPSVISFKKYLEEINYKNNH